MFIPKGMSVSIPAKSGHFAEEGEEKSVRAGGWEEAEEMMMSRCDMGFTFTNSQL